MPQNANGPPSRRFSVPIRRISVYDSPSRFFLVGVDYTETRYSVLKIDRTDVRNLALCDGGANYSQAEVNELLTMLNDSTPQPANAASNKSDRKGKTGGLTERVRNAVGLLGFVRFLEGYYMVLITKASPVAQLGYHTIQKIEDVVMVYIPSEELSNSNMDEIRYLRLFQSVDLTTNFYFSFTYDLSRTLQSNIVDSTGESRSEFVWNSYLMEQLKEHGRTCERWTTPVVHGFVGRSVVSSPAAVLSLLLVARRSRRFAGTRFLRRGASLDGWVANDVETEQIAWDQSSSASFLRGRFTSFVQRRASVPLAWSQNPLNRPLMGKPPPITLDLADPFAQIAGAHFRRMQQDYNSPIIVVNLVKRREKRVHESVLHDQLKKSICYLNQFLPPEEALLYLSFDVARCNKVGQVLPKLEDLGYNVVPKTGWFQSFPPLYCHEVRRTALLDEYTPRFINGDNMLLQHGVLRTNCVDCLDRTNVAQFVVGKVALACQLYSMGLLSEPRLSLNTAACDALEALYEDHGDTLALQYAGSQLVHSIKTYKKTAVFQERSRDVIQTLSRYYSNTFNDQDKQMAINLFLGIYRVDRHRQQSSLPHLWDLQTDTYLHNPVTRPKADYCCWFEEPLSSSSSSSLSSSARSLCPAAAEEEPVTDDNDVTEIDDDDQWSPSDFDLHYRTFELTSFDTLLPALNQTKTTYVDSLGAESASQPPVLKLWKQKGEGDQKADKKKKGGADDTRSVSASSTGAADGESSSEDETVHSDVDIVYHDDWVMVRPRSSTVSTGDSDNYRRLRERIYDPSMGLARGLLSIKQAYGFDIRPPSTADQQKYEAYCRLGLGGQIFEEDLEWMRRRRTLIRDDVNWPVNKMETMSLFTNDSAFGVAVPVVSESAMRKYRESVSVALNGPKSPSAADQLMYNQYVCDRLRM